MYNIFEKQENLEVRNAQIVYMAEELEMTPSEIKKYVNLAVSTIKTYIYKFADLIDKAREWFGDKTKQVINKLKEKCGFEDTITYDNCTPKAGDCSYIIEYFDSERNFLFLKVGMTNNISRRVKEHLKYYVNHGYDTAYAVVKEIHYAEDEEDALTLENLYRKHYKAIPDCGFIKRDRFATIRYDKEELEQDTALMTKVQMFEMAAV